jgi:alpha-tubulin suppressor-like RCC1 family protein
MLALAAIAALGQTEVKVKSWGWNWYGQLGNGYSYLDDLLETLDSTPAAVPGLTDVSAIAAGAGSSLALKKNGTVWAWGAINGSNLPARVTELTGVIAIAAGGDSNSTEPWYPYPEALALKSDGTVLQPFGNGWNVVPGLTGIVAIASGSYHSLALKNDGTVWAWNLEADPRVPVRIPNLTGVKAISARWQGLALALKDDGTVWAWEPLYFQNAQPRSVKDLTGVVAIAWDLALKANGTVWTVGWNNNEPVATGVSALTGVVAIAADLALKGDGTVWNYNIYDEDWRPVSGLNGVSSVAGHHDDMGYHNNHSLALKSDGKVWAWGANRWGQLGNAASLHTGVPRVTKTLTGAVAVAAGAEHSLGLRYDGTVWEWGCEWLSYDGTIGDILASCGRDHPSVPQTMTDPNGNIPVKGVAIAAGARHSFVLKDDGTVWQRGKDIDTGAVSGLAGMVAIAAGDYHSLALKSDGTVWAWGGNWFGQLGKGDAGDYSTVPLPVSGLTGVVAIAAGVGHSLALRSDGTVWTWGCLYVPEVGSECAGPITVVPVAVSNLTGVVAIAGGIGYNLALKSDGTVWVWGCQAYHPYYGCTGASSDVPVLVKNLAGVVAIAAGTGQNLALKSDGTVWEWGAGIDVPRLVTNLTGAVSIAAGTEHSLAAIGSGIPELTVNSKAVNFGNQSVGTTGTARTISVTNGGDRPLEIKAVTLLGINAGEFTRTADSCTAATLTPGGSCGISAKFAPSGQGSRTGALLITSNAPGSAHLVTLKGTGITGQASITVVAPNSAVNWALGSEHLIKWNHSGLGSGSSVNLEVSRDAGSTWSPIAGSIPNTGTYLWTVSGPATAKARIRVSWTANTTARDMSNVNFTIAAPFIRVTKPNGGETWKKSSTQTVTWASNLGSSEYVKIELSTNGGGSWLSVAEAAPAAPDEAEMDPLSTLVGSTPSDGSQKVVLPPVTSNKCRVRITWLDNAAVADTSNANFRIIP